VFSGQGPSSKVSTTSLGRRKSYCLKCSKPKPGPPVVSISTTRERPMPPGLSHAAILPVGAGTAAASVAVAPSGRPAVFCATRCGAAEAGGGDTGATEAGAEDAGSAGTVV
jgi:hypothetical protein